MTVLGGSWFSGLSDGDWDVEPTLAASVTVSVWAVSSYVCCVPMWVGIPSGNRPGNVHPYTRGAHSQVTRPTASYSVTVLRWTGVPTASVTDVRRLSLSYP